MSTNVRAGNSKSTFKTRRSTPTLIRTSKLSSEYLREKLIPENVRVKLLYTSDLNSMTENWLEEEIQNQRRLVKFKFSKKSISHFEISFDSINASEFDHTLPIISCIYWRERNTHIVTSVDIVLILEYLIEQSFSVEEKNRIRRNLQNLKPYTITRNNKDEERFFAHLMKMENPRPRNIEKDLKVFQWKDLLTAVERVVSKYSPNFKKVQEKSLPKSLKDIIHAENDEDPNIESENAPFLPNERLKVLKKQLQLDQLGLLSGKLKHTLFQHAIKPTAPIPILPNIEDNKSRDSNNIVDTKSPKQLSYANQVTMEQVLNGTSEPQISPTDADSRLDSGSVFSKMSNEELSQTPQSTHLEQIDPEKSNFNREICNSMLGGQKTISSQQYFQYPAMSQLYSKTLERHSEFKAPDKHLQTGPNISAKTTLPSLSSIIPEYLPQQVHSGAPPYPSPFAMPQLQTTPQHSTYPPSRMQSQDEQVYQENSFDHKETKQQTSSGEVSYVFFQIRDMTAK